jgi:SAM-dependent methyltransferase
VITVDFRKTAIAPDVSVLDVGCGSGRHLGAACRYPSITVVGADLCFADLVSAAERLQYHEQIGANDGGRWHLAAADSRWLPFRDRSFDLVICSEVLEHIEDHRTAVTELVRVLKNGGELVVSVPRYWPERICWYLSKAYRQAEGGHVRIYRKHRLIEFLQQSGVRPQGAHYSHSLHTPYWWLKCLLGPEKEAACPVKLYRRFLTWDIMQQPALTRFAERLLNPLLGKSLVVYFKKP